MGPRADFSCKPCGRAAKKAGPLVYEDLPVKCVRCPVCGNKRGFERLFTAGGGGVMSSRTRRIDKLSAKYLEPAYKKHNDTREGAKRFEQAATEAVERSTHEATPKEREAAAAAKTFRGHSAIIPAAAALSHVPPQARIDSRELVYPALTRRTVIPDYTQPKRG